VVTVTRQANGSSVTVVRRNVQVDSREHEADSKTVTNDTQRWSIKGLAAVQPLKSGELSYGLEVDYRIVGPFEVGVFGLTDGTLGVGVGIRF
jgi:hypothetical protein